MIDVAELSLDDLKALYLKVTAELSKRDAAEKADAALAKAVDEFATATGATRPAGDGEPWRQPSGVHDAYRLKAVVTHAGKRWVSLVPWNVWKPGVSGWREVPSTSGDGPPKAPAWVQPTGAHDAYKKGDRVTYEGAAWASTVDANVWAPGVHGWKKV